MFLGTSKGREKQSILMVRGIFFFFLHGLSHDALVQDLGKLRTEQLQKPMLIGFDWNPGICFVLFPLLLFLEEQTFFTAQIGRVYAIGWACFRRNKFHSR